MDTRSKIAVMQAYEDGKTIQIYDNEIEDWRDVESTIGWDWIHHIFRIKPEPKLRPYKDAEEFLQAQKEHGMYIEINEGHYVLPNNILGNEIQVNCSKQLWGFSELMDKKWQDGTPCGVMEE